MTPLALLLLACTSKPDPTDTSPDTSVTEPTVCEYDWRGAPCDEDDYLNLAHCDPCSRAWLCKQWSPTDPFTTWQRLEIRCECVNEYGEYTDTEECRE